MLVAAAVCPHPPLLIPEAMGAAGLRPAAGDQWITELLTACGAAVAALAAAGPDLLVVVGGGTETARYDPAAGGSLRAFGIPYSIGAGDPVLPLSLTVGSWLLGRFLPAASGHAGDADRARGRSGRVHTILQAVRRSQATTACLRLGAKLAASAPSVALLAMGDGSARKAIGAPGGADPAARAYDAEVAAALADADPVRLARLDPGRDDELIVAGRAAWQVLAGAASDGSFRGRLHYAGAPLDVGYLVAAWVERPVMRATSRSKATRSRYV